MKISQWTMIAVMAVGLPASAAAQDRPAGTSGTYSDENRWIASGFVGSNFANNANPASFNFGGSIDYLFRNRYGAEFDAEFAPKFGLQNNVLGVGVKPDVNTYMVNAIGAFPVGSDGRWQPYVSGGVGAMSLRSGLAVNSFGNPMGNANRFGGDIGGGVMGFVGRWGFKADVRYFRATGSYTPPALSSTGPTGPTGPGPYGVISTPVPNQVTNLAGSALAGLHFWQGNVGIAVRF